MIALMEKSGNNMQVTDYIISIFAFCSTSFKTENDTFLLVLFENIVHIETQVPLMQLLHAYISP